MYFKNLILCAIVLSIAASAVLSVYQYLWLTPIIIGSEIYEAANATTSLPTVATRHYWNFASNFAVCFAFSMLLLALMSLKSSLSSAEGILWGGIAYLSIFVLPALGLPPEIPGMQAAALTARQAWWLYTAIASATGLSLVFYQPIPYKLLGVLLITTPHLLGAPSLQIHTFTNPTPTAIANLTLLWQQFITQTSIANLLLWMILGLGGSFLVRRYVHTLK